MVTSNQKSTLDIQNKNEKEITTSNQSNTKSNEKDKDEKLLEKN